MQPQVQQSVTVNRGAVPLDAVAVITVGRLMFSETSLNIMESIARFAVPVSFNCYPYWEQGITLAIEGALATGRKWLLFFDGDSVYQQSDLEKLYELAESDAKIDAVVPIQADRNGPNPLCYNWQAGDKKIEYDYREPVIQVAHGHFGLTFIRAQVFKDLPKPWFMGHPGKGGEWKLEAGKIDPDTHFWLQFNKHGKVCAQANHITIGHQMMMARWQMPWGAFAQSLSEFREKGAPVGARAPYLDEVAERENKDKALKLMALAAELSGVQVPTERVIPTGPNTSATAFADTEKPHTYGEAPADEPQAGSNGQHQAELSEVTR